MKVLIRVIYADNRQFEIDGIGLHLIRRSVKQNPGDIHAQETVKILAAFLVRYLRFGRRNDDVKS